MSDSINQEKLQKLREPFPASAISKLPKGGTSLSYVGHANVTDRFLNIDPLWNWEPFALDERGLPALDYDAQGAPVGLWIRLTICGVTRPGYGTCEARKSEPIKELVGDALRNAAMRFGVALELWSKADLESQHSDDPPRASTPAPRQNAPQPPQRANNGTQSGAPPCPKCHGAMWDNRAKKADGSISAKSPDFKCKNKENCDGVIWPPDNGQRRTPVAPAGPTPEQIAARKSIPMTGAQPREQLAAEFDNDDSDPFGELDAPPYPAN